MLSIKVLRNADVARLLSGQLLSQICDKMVAIGLGWVIVAERSADELPWFLAAGALPHLLLAWTAGKWASRLGPLRTVVSMDIARGALFLIAGGMWQLVPADHQWPSLVALTVLANVAAALFNPAILSLPSQLPDKEILPQTTAAIDSCFAIANVLGPLAVVALYPWLGLRGVLLANGASYLLAGALEAGVRTEGGTAETGKEPVAPQPAWAVLHADRLLLFLLVTFFLMNLVLSPLLAFLPIVAKTEFAGGIDLLAGLELSMGIGTVAGSVGLSLTRLPWRTGTKATAGLVLVSAMYLLFGLGREPAVACAALGVLGLALSVTNVSMLTLLQTRPTPENVPVVMSLVNLIAIGSAPFAMSMTGLLLDHVDLRKLMVVFALVLAGLTGAALLNRELRSL